MRLLLDFIHAGADQAAVIVTIGLGDMLATAVRIGIWRHEILWYLRLKCGASRGLGATIWLNAEQVVIFIYDFLLNVD